MKVYRVMTIYLERPVVPMGKPPKEMSWHVDRVTIVGVFF